MLKSTSQSSLVPALIHVSGLIVISCLSVVVLCGCFQASCTP